MKKIILFLFAMGFGLTLNAQTKGEMYLAGAIGASFGSQTSELTIGSVSTRESEPLGSTFQVQGEFAYFITDNVRLAVAFGVPYSKTPDSQDEDNNWLYTKTIGLSFNPNIAYYCRLADRFYYTPEIGFSYESGDYKEDQTVNTTYNADYSAYTLYLNMLAFEFRVSDKFALGVMAGSVSYNVPIIEDKESDVSLRMNQLGFNLNEGAIAARFYF